MGQTPLAEALALWCHTLPLSHPTAPTHLALLLKQITARLSYGRHALQTGIGARFVQLMKKVVTTATGAGATEDNFGNLSSRRQTLCSPPCFPGCRRSSPPDGRCGGHASRHRDQRDGSEARASLLTRGCEAAKPHPSNGSARLSHRERSGLCLHGKIALVSFRVRTQIAAIPRGPSSLEKCESLMPIN